MKSPFLCAIPLVLCTALVAGAWDELGPLSSARRAHPEYFKKGAVHRVELDGVGYWIFAGDSDRRDGFSVLTDTERYAEAALDARRNLLRYVAGVSNVTAEVSGIVTAYRLSDGSARRVVCLVPVENVVVVTPKSTRSATTARPAAPASSSPAPGTPATGGPSSSTAVAQPAAPVSSAPAPEKPATGEPPSSAAVAQPAAPASSPPAPETPVAEDAPSSAAAAQPAAPGVSSSHQESSSALPDAPSLASPRRFQMPTLPTPVLPGDAVK